jgi:hypothetical protein
LASRRFVVVLATIFTVFWGHRALVQSPDMDRPTLLKSAEQKVVVEREGAHYYAFDAGPGEVTVMVAVTHLVGTVKLLDPNMRELVSEVIVNTENYEQQKMLRVNLTRKAGLCFK